MICVTSDGSNAKDGSQTQSVVIIRDHIDTLAIQISNGGPGWSDVAEYWAIKQGLEKLIDMGLNNEIILWEGDSQFVMKQLQGEYRIKPGKAYSSIAKECLALIRKFRNITFRWIPREDNQMADSLSKIQKEPSNVSYSQIRKDVEL